MTAGEIVSLIVGLFSIGAILVAILFFLVRLQMAHNDLKKDREYDHEWLERTSVKADNTNKIVRLMYMNQQLLLQKVGVQAVSPEDSSIDLPKV